MRKELVPPSKKKLFSEIQEYIELRQMIAVIGLRRTGKTTILLQIIDMLIKEGTPPENILYFSFDETVEDLRDVIDLYRENILS